jgi:hypothetical protein
MRRVAAIVLFLCAGCASPGEQTLLEDSLFGDVRAMFSPGPSSTSSSVPNNSYPTMNSCTSPTIRQNQ